MRISTEIASFKQYGTNKQILKLLKDADFEAYDFSMFVQTPENLIYCDDYIERAKDLRKYADEIGIVCNQAHAPFPLYAPEKGGWRSFLVENISKGTGVDIENAPDPDQEYFCQMQKLIYRAVEIAGILGAPNCVVHPHNHFNAEENKQMYQAFISASKQYGAKIAVENMWNWPSDADHAVAAACSHHDDFQKHMDLLSADTFVACLDIGHAEMKGLETDSYTMITTLGDRLACLHIHDNDKLHDSHDLPYTNKIQFADMCKALVEIGYRGDLTFEADSYMRRFSNDFFPTAARYMYQIGDYLRKQILGK